MLNVNKLPNLQPKKKKPVKGVEPPETLWQQLKQGLGRSGWFLAGLSICLIYFTVCFQAERGLRGGLYKVLKEVGSNGFGVSYSEPKSAYLAFKSGLYFDDLVITAPKQMGGWQWKAPRISISLNPFAPRDVVIALRGTHSLIMAHSGDIRLVAEKADVLVHMSSREEMPSVDIILENIQATAPASATGFRLDKVSLKVRQLAEFNESGISYSYAVLADKVQMPFLRQKGLPEKLDYLNINGSINSFSRQRQKPLLDDWISNSGTIEITRGEIIWPPLMAEFTGTTGFDPSLDMIAAANAKIYGFFDMLDRLEKAEIIRSSNVSLAKVVLGPKLKIEQGESRLSLTSPLSIQFGKIYAGQVVLY